MTAIRHGDILLIKVEQVQGELKLLPRDKRLGVVLAYGESTGHAHHLLAEDSALYVPVEPGKCSFLLDGVSLKIDTVGGGIPHVLTVSSPTVLLHHDHGLGVPNGTDELRTPIEPAQYVVIRQRERSFAEIVGYQRVTD